MKEKKPLFLDSYFDFDSIFPQEYFEISFRETARGYWLIYYANDEGETIYGPYEEKELISRITLAPFYFEEIVLIYHLIESRDPDLHNLGVRLLKSQI